MVKNLGRDSDDMVPNISRRGGAGFHSNFTQDKIHPIDRVGDWRGRGNPRQIRRVRGIGNLEFRHGLPGTEGIIGL